MHLQTARNRINALPPQGTRDVRPALLREMIHHLPAGGRQAVVDDISACQDDDALRGLADHYLSTVFWPIKVLGGQTPAPTPSPADSRHEVDQFDDSMGPSANRVPTRILEAQCLPRDGYRCIVTGGWSAKADSAMLPANFDPLNRVPTRICHAIPSAMAHYDNSQAAEHNAAARWRTLFRLFPGLSDSLADFANINDPSNLITGSLDVHDALGAFNLAFERTTGVNRYRMLLWGAVGGILPHLPANKIIQIRRRGGNKVVPLPSPILLATHCIVAKILHGSGAAEAMEDVQDEYLNMRCLAEDGSTNLPFFVQAPVM